MAILRAKNETLTVIISTVWVFITGHSRRRGCGFGRNRSDARIGSDCVPGAIAREDGHLFSCTVHDFSDGGLGIKINGQAQIAGRAESESVA